MVARLYDDVLNHSVSDWLKMKIEWVGIIDNTSTSHFYSIAEIHHLATDL